MWTACAATITQIKAGYWFTCAASINQVWCWGDGDSYATGSGSKSDLFAPALVLNQPGDVSKVSAEDKENKYLRESRKDFGIKSVLLIAYDICLCFK